MTPWDLISKCPENQAAVIAQYLGLSHLLRKGVESSPPSQRHCFLLWWWMKDNNSISLLVLFLIFRFPHQLPWKPSCSSLLVLSGHRHIFTPSRFWVSLLLVSLSFFVTELEGTYPGQCRGFCLIIATCHFYFKNVSWIYSQVSVIDYNNSSCLLLNTYHVPGVVQSPVLPFFSVNLDILHGVDTIFIFLWTQLGFESKSKSKTGTWHHALKQELILRGSVEPKQHK